MKIRRYLIWISLFFVLCIIGLAFAIIPNIESASAGGTGTDGGNNNNNGGSEQQRFKWFTTDISANASDLRKDAKRQGWLFDDGWEGADHTIGGWDNYLNGLIAKAKVKCAENDLSGQCPNPRIVSYGIAVKISGKYNSHVSSSANWGSYVYPYDKTGPISVQGAQIPLDKVLNNTRGKSIKDQSNDMYASLKDSRGNYNAIVIITVIGQNQIERKGWYPKWERSDRVDVSSANKISTEQLGGCPVDYMMYAYGVDGYVKDQVVDKQVYHTPYGDLWDAVAKGGSWHQNEKYGGNPAISYGPFVGNWSTQAAKIAELKAAKAEACKETYNMHITYDLKEGKTVYIQGGDLKAEDRVNKDTGAVVTSTPASIDNKRAQYTDYNKDNKNDSKDFLVRFSKGGIYKVVKMEKIATLDVKSPSVTYFKRGSTWFEFKGWYECKEHDTISADMMGLGGLAKNGYSNWNGNKCGYLSQPKPSGWAGLTTDPYDGKGQGFFVGTYNSSSAWEEDSKVGGAIQSADKSGKSARVDGKIVSALFNRGYVTKWNCQGQEVTAASPGQNSEKINTGQCKAVDWNFQNDVLGWNKPDKIHWSAGGSAAWYSGSANRSGAIGTLNGQLHPVSNKLQSYVAVSFKDYMHVNCNKTDFDKYIAAIRSINTIKGKDGKDYKILEPNGPGDKVYVNSERFTGDLATAELPVSAGGVVSEPLLRAIETLGGARYNNTMDGELRGEAAIKKGLLESNPGSEAKVDDTYRKYITEYFADNGTVNDPFYTKECSYNCVDTDTTGGAKIKNIRDSSTDAAAKDARNYGVKVNASDENGNVSTNWTNNAIMTFFKNNADNNFIVDVWHPQDSEGTVKWDGSEAKTTTIVSNRATSVAEAQSDSSETNGTPWVSRNNVIGNLTTLTVQGQNNKLFQIGDLKKNTDPDLERLSPTKQTTLDAKRTETLDGQVNAFTIKSPWAGDNGKPLQFNIRWEYETKNTVPVPSTFTSSSNGDANEVGVSSTFDDDYDEIVVDGHCESNSLNKGKTDTEKAYHDNSGFGSVNNLDDRFHEHDDEEHPYGKFVIQFVRGTAE